MFFSINSKNRVITRIEHSFTIIQTTDFPTALGFLQHPKYENYNPNEKNIK